MTQIRRDVPTGGMLTAFPPRAFAITASDTTEYPEGVAVWVGGDGDVVVEPLWGAGEQAPDGYSDTTLTFTMTAGNFVPVTVKRVLAASDAPGMVAVY